MNKLPCFKAYDIRGHLSDELNEDTAYRIGRAYREYLKPKDEPLMQAKTHELLKLIRD